MSKRGSFSTTRKDSGADQIRKSVNKIPDGRSFVAVGIVSAAKHLAKAGGQELSIAQIATFAEFGTENAPARSFLRAGFKHYKNEAQELTKRLYKDVTHGKRSVHEALGILGEWWKARIKEFIRAGIEPANAPSTIKAKGSSLPLVDTAQMINAIDYKVEEK